MVQVGARTMVRGPSSAPEDCRLQEGSLRATVRAPAPLWPDRGGDAAAGLPAMAACAQPCIGLVCSVRLHLSWTSPCMPHKSLLS